MDTNKLILDYLQSEGASHVDKIVRELPTSNPGGNSHAHIRVHLSRLIKRNLVRESAPDIYILKPEEEDRQIGLF